LRTDLPKSQNATDNRCPVPDLGIALSTNQKVLQMRSIEPGQLSIPALEAAFSSAEEREIAKSNAAADLARSLGFPSSTALNARSRSAFPIKVERVWRQILNSGESVAYFEASRTYARSTNFQSDCPTIATFQGWIVKGKASPEKFIGITVRLTDCDYKEASFVTPMGLLELPGGVFAITQIDGWESQSYAVLKIDADGIRTLVDSPVR
jgi:hypothetical protein